jgi:hypothetical protein
MVEGDRDMIDFFNWVIELPQDEARLRAMRESTRVEARVNRASPGSTEDAYTLARTS